ncbi:MAG: UDP-3-O-(3-hydroxymyristoyl)glucosamine N-acyltransferase [Lewinellaceae bacterium]|nr:UDP-3-O-(3-hydroxymyristoyl)glucosamine N-acyltransferase [Lewinellaceae bacterium]
MKLSHPITVKDFSRKYDLQIIGGENALITGVNEIHKVTPGDLTFVDVEKYYQASLTSAATFILINKEVPCPEGKVLLVTSEPFAVFNDFLWSLRPFATEFNGEKVNIGEGSVIDPNVTIGKNVVIGSNCYIQSGVFIGDDTIIGDDVHIESGTIIGTDAFYYKKKDGKFTKWRSVGRVCIENNVNIGAGCTINRGVTGDTIIGEGTKLDCQIHIGHGVVIGKHCLIAAQVGISGKTIIEDHVTIYGQVGIAQNVRIGSESIILGQSGVTKSIPGKTTYFGTPIEEASTAFKHMAFVRSLYKSK